MAGSRRHAGTVPDGRRRSKRPRPPEDVRRRATAWQRGRRRTRDNGMTAWQPRSARGDRNNESDGVANGHCRRRTDKSIECQTGCDERPSKLRRTHAKEATRFSGKETSCCVQDKQGEANQLFAIAAVRSKRTQKSLRACPYGSTPTR